MSLLAVGAFVVLSSPLPAAEPELLWDNDLALFHLSNGHALSPPVFPLIRQADDFVVDEESWIVTDIVFGTIEDAGWVRGDVLEIHFYEDGGGNCPGALRRLFETAYDAEFQDAQGFDRDVYHYWVSDLELALEAGRHWLGPRNPEGGGAGTNYWLECSFNDFYCGDDPRDTYPNCSSLDEGNSWQGHGNPYHFQFRLYGFPALDAVPFVFDVTRGQRVAGGLLSLGDDDGDRLRVAAIRPSQVSQPSVEVLVEAFSPVDFSLATAIGFTLDAHATAPAIERIDLYNFVEGRWVRLHEAAASVDTDRTTDVVVRENVSAFITPASSRMAARISYYDPGIPIAGWFGAIDRTVWRVGRPAP